ncbi:hypothetical protein Salat_1941500 [Sesamum alatum]|uniref:Uncharacterized protein n=1 Tax=Sesamum alatum TaxID=300844 RepID=A0AAE2CIP1_9LAMI|nr:hypothetical protein Salat_1941500 [Sesamum alatum]
MLAESLRPPNIKATAALAFRWPPPKRPARPGARLHGPTVVEFLREVCPEELKDCVDFDSSRPRDVGSSRNFNRFGQFSLPGSATSLENKNEVLKEIASDNNIDLPMRKLYQTVEWKIRIQAWRQQSQSISPSRISNQGENKSMLLQPDEIEGVRCLCSGKPLEQLWNVRGLKSTDPDDPNSPSIRLRHVSATIRPIKAGLQTHEEDPVEDEQMKLKFKGDKNGILNSRDHFLLQSSDSSDDDVKGVSVSSDEEGQSKKGGAVFDGSDGEDEQEMRVPGTYDLDAGEKNDALEGRSRAQVGVKMKTGPGIPLHNLLAGEENSQIIEPLNINRKRSL